MTGLQLPPAPPKGGKMLVHNKYLEKLGVTKDTYPLGESCTHETELDKDMGVIPCQTWNLNLILAMELYTYVKAFRDITPGYPACFENIEEWYAVLDEIADGFADYITRRDEIDFNADYPKLNRSFNLLKEYWEALWW